jgi:RHS repeat-associated protein
MGGKVTALGLDTITEKSGHGVVPVAPSVCTTPAAPSPMPVPYPATGTSREGIVGAPSRTKINGARAGTVGSALKACHGNEPGTLKEVVSVTTGGPVTILAGAPTVVCELGMMGVTGSGAMANKGPGPSARMAPAPMAGPAMAASTIVLGGGTSSGDANGDAASGADNAGGHGHRKGGHGEGGEKHAAGGKDGQCSGGHPVDVVTGRAYTLPLVDLELPGPLALRFARTYSTAAAERDVGLGHGWAHSWGWEIEVRRRAIVVWSDEGIAVDFPELAIGAEVIGSWGWLLRREAEGFVLDTGDGLRLTFSSAAEKVGRFRLSAITDRNDNRIALTYDGARLAQVVDSAGRIIRVLSTREGRILSLSAHNAAGRGRWIVFASYSYDSAGNLTKATDAERHTWRYAYDPEHRLTLDTDRCGLAFHFVYDRAGRCVETWGDYPGKRDPSVADDVPAVLANGHTRAKGIHHCRFEFDGDGYTELADSTQVRRYFGNQHGLVDKRVEGGGVVTATYDDHGHMLAEMDAMGEVTTFARDARGRVVRVVDPLGHVTAIERDAHGLPVRVADAAGGVTEIQRDAHGNEIQRADPTGGTTSTTYDERGLVTSITSPTGGVTRIAYDRHGNPIEQTESNGARWRWTYDALGRRTSEVDPLGAETRFVWTDRGDLAAVHDAAGGVTRYTYDGERRLCEVQGPGRRTLGLTWGGYNKLVSRTNGAGDAMRLRYTREGELVEVYNEKGEVHKILRNGAGLVVREETFDGRRIAYRYDAAGRLTRSESAVEVTEYSYDAAGALTSRTLPDDTVESFSYDARGDLVRAAWPGGEVRFERDDAGRIVRELQALGDEEHTVTSLYDAGGERVRRFTSRGHVEQIERDAAGARTRTVLDDQQDVHHTRDLLGRELSRGLPDGGRIEHAYDPLGRVLRRWATAPGSLHPVRPDDPAWSAAAVPAQPDRITVEKKHRYDAERELSKTVDRRRGPLAYAYDAAGRLLTALHADTGARETFRYDAAGNPQREGDPCVYGPGGRLLRRGSTAYVWDEAGRLAEKREVDEVWRYTWDPAGRLAAVELPDARHVAYSYDPFGRRVEARIYEAPPPVGRARLTERTRFVWDGDTLAHAIRTRAAAAGDPIIEERTYCFEDGGFVPWAHRETEPDEHGGRRSAWAFYANDPIGTPEELVDGVGGVLASLDRRPWGPTEAAEGARASTPLRFQGQYADCETGLFYNRHRYYDPEAGLYLSPDPLGLEGGPRPYGYGVNPVRWIDPLGLAVNTPNTGVIYLRRDKTGEYVGRSKSWEAYQRRKRAHLRCNLTYAFGELQTGIAGPDVAQAEEDWIRAGGGPGRLQNKIHGQAAKNYKGKVRWP